MDDDEPIVLVFKPQYAKAPRQFRFLPKNKIWWDIAWNREANHWSAEVLDTIKKHTETRGDTDE